MTTGRRRVRVEEAIERYGRCLELVAVDPHFQEITVGLYEKHGVLTVWSYSGRPGVQGRLRQIRDRLVDLGGVVPVEGADAQARFACGQVHARPLGLVMADAVRNPPDREIPAGDIVVKDPRSALLLRATPREEDGRWVYVVSAEGEAPERESRVQATAAGLARYGDMERVGPDTVSFSCRARHDELVRLLLRYARNVTTTGAR